MTMSTKQMTQGQVQRLKVSLGMTFGMPVLGGLAFGLSPGLSLALFAIWLPALIYFTLKANDMDRRDGEGFLHEEARTQHNIKTVVVVTQVIFAISYAIQSSIIK
jgi:hypothetical protein